MKTFLFYLVSTLFILGFPDMLYLPFSDGFTVGLGLESLLIWIGYGVCLRGTGELLVNLG